MNVVNKDSKFISSQSCYGVVNCIRILTLVWLEASMRIIRRLGSVGVLAMLACCSVALGQTPPATAVPFISQVTPPSIAPAANSALIVQFTLTILGANFPQNAAVKLTLPQGPSLYAASVSVNATGSQIVAQFNTTLPRPAVYAVTVSNAVNNPTAVSNVFYLPVTPPATTVEISQREARILFCRL